jgi:phage terminase large subunit
MADITLPEKLRPIFDPYRYKIAYGGRASGKSHGIAIALLLLAGQSSLRILCVREFQNSIKESCHKLLCDYIDNLGLNDFYDTSQNKISGKNGSEFIFSGIKNNPQSIKSLEGIDIAWVEEAQTLSKPSLEILIPTIRKPGSEIWFSMNPTLKTDPVYEMIDKPSDNTLLININYWDNPYCPDVMLDEAENMKRLDYENWLHIWGGDIRRISDSIIFNKKYKIADVNPGQNWNGPYFGCDFGFATDPTTLVKCWVYNKVLYIEKEVVAYHVDTDKLPSRFSEIPNSEFYTIRADCSRPETISQLKTLGYTKMIGCKKWNGSVEDGIAFIRSFEGIIIDRSCKVTIDEFMNYSYKVDKLSGDILPDIIDKYNHCIDAIRYALEPLIMQRRPGSVRIYN